MKPYSSPFTPHPTVMVLAALVIVCLFALLPPIGGAQLSPEKKPKGTKELIYRRGASRVNSEVRMNGTGWDVILLHERTKLDLYNSIRIDIGAILTIGSGSVRIRRMMVENGGLTMLVGLINDGTHGVDDKTFEETMKKNINNPNAMPLTREAYKMANKNEGNLPVISGFTGNILESSSICSDTISPDNCIMIIGIAVTIACAIIMALMTYFFCIKSPFDVSPMPIDK